MLFQSLLLKEKFHLKRLTFGRIAEGGQGLADLSIQAVIKTRGGAVECHCLPMIESIMVHATELAHCIQAV